MGGGAGEGLRALFAEEAVVAKFKVGQVVEVRAVDERAECVVVEEVSAEVERFEGAHAGCAGEAFDGAGAEHVSGEREALDGVEEWERGEALAAFVEERAAVEGERGEGGHLGEVDDAQDGGMVGCAVAHHCRLDRERGEVGERRERVGDLGEFGGGFDAAQRQRTGQRECGREGRAGGGGGVGGFWVPPCARRFAQRVRPGREIGR